MSVLLVLALLISAQEDVDVLIRNLGDESVAVREEATVSLRKLGEKARQKLEAAAATGDAGVKVRAAALLATLDREQKERSWLPPATRITLSGTMTLKQALESVESQGGRKVAVEAWPVEPFKIDLKDLPYWIALEEICKASGQASLVCEPAGPMLVAGKGVVALASTIRGPFRIHVAKVVDRVGFDFDQNREDRSCTVVLSLGWEAPRGPARLYVKVDAAVDEHGNDLAAAMRENLRFTGHDVVFAPRDKPLAASQLELRSGVPLMPQAKRFARIAGSITAYFRASDEDISIPADKVDEWSPVLEVSDENAEEPIRGEAKVFINRGGGNDLHVRVSLRSFDSRLVCTLGDLWKLKAAGGKELNGWSSSVTDNDPQATRLTFEFQGAAGLAGVKSMDVPIPRRLIRREIPFEFKDVRVR